MIDDQPAAPWDRQYAPATPGLPVEVVTLAQLRRRCGDELLQRPGRVFFHVALICTSGEGFHEVDYTPVVLQPRRVVHVRPGQVHRWRFARNYRATLVFFPDTARDLHGAGWSVGPRWFDLDESTWSHTKALLRLMQDGSKLERSPERRRRSLNGALQMLIVDLGLDLPHDQDTAHLPRPYVELLDQMEDDPDWSRSVKKRARRLGYSERTLTRACMSATGRTAKQVIDDRILLEAQRLLAGDGESVSSVARLLGFSEAGNFSKFFHRITGESPAGWRQRHHPPAVT